LFIKAGKGDSKRALPVPVSEKTQQLTAGVNLINEMLDDH
jgi:hypothetical protein